jgi:hypothetical protein
MPTARKIKLRQAARNKEKLDLNREKLFAPKAQQQPQPQKKARTQM